MRAKIDVEVVDPFEIPFGAWLYMPEEERDQQRQEAKRRIKGMLEYERLRGAVFLFFCGSGNIVRLRACNVSDASFLDYIDLFAVAQDRAPYLFHWDESEGEWRVS